MNNPTYRIKVEVIGPETEHIDEEYLKGIECDGFVLIANQDDGCTTGIQSMNTIDIAQSIAKCDVLLAAAHLGKAMKETAQMEARAEHDAALRKATSDLVERLSKETGIQFHKE